MLVITIDSGTSNTRAKLWQDGHLLAKSFAQVGVRDTVISGSRQSFRWASGKRSWRRRRPPELTSRGWPDSGVGHDYF